MPSNQPHAPGATTWDVPSPTRDSLDHRERVALAGLRSRLLGVETDPVSIGRYVVKKRLGAGGMGTVYEAHDPRLDRLVAVKVLQRDRVADDVASRRMMREAQAMARLNHPNIVGVLDVGLDNGRVFIAMECIRGRSADRWLAEARSRDEIVRVFAQAAEGLAAAHAHGLVHRDFKPSNVLVGDDGRARVVDFGLAREATRSRDATVPASIASGAAGGPLTRTGALLGTPAYMAPEQWLGRADARSDQFSLCFALLEVLLGERPFDPRAHALLDLCDAPSEAPGPWRLGDRRLERALRRGVACRPSERWRSMSVLARELRGDATPNAKRIVPVVGLGSLLLATSVFTGEDEPCRDGRNRLRAHFSPSRAEAVHAALRRSPTAHGEATAATVSAALDNYADAWVDSWRNVCETGTTADLERVKCLHDRGAELSKLVGLLERADRSVANHALDAVSSLTAPDECLTLPTRQTVADEAPRVAELRLEVAAAVALRRVGQNRAALAALRAIEDEIRRSGHAGLGVDLDLASGWALAAIDHPTEATEHLRTAYFTATELGRSDAAFDAAALIAGLSAHDLARPDHAFEWIEHARAALERGPDNPSRRADLARVVGFAHWHSGDFDRALPALTRALSLHEQTHGEHSPALIGALHDLGRLHLTRGAFADAEQHYRRSLVISRAALGANDPKAALALNGLGYCSLGQGHNDDAIDNFETARRVFADSYGHDSIKVAAADDGLSLALMMAGRIDEARAPAGRALNIARAMYGDDHPETARARGRVAQVDAESGDEAAARRGHRAALAIFERTQGETSPEAQQSRLDIAVATEALGDVDAAIEMLSEVVKTQEAHGRRDGTTANALFRLGRLQHQLGDEAAERTLVRSQALAATGVVRPTTLAKIERHLAELRQPTTAERR